MKTTLLVKNKSMKKYLPHEYLNWQHITLKHILIQIMFY